MWKNKINTNRWEIKLVMLSLTFIVLTVCFSRTYHRYVVPLAQKDPGEFFVNAVQENQEYVSLKKGDVSQTIRVDYNGLSAVGIRIGRRELKRKEKDSEKILVQIYDAENSMIVQENQISVQQVDGGGLVKIELERELVGVPGHPYRIEISYKGKEQVYLYVSKEDTYEKGECLQNGKILLGDISFSLYGSSYKFIKNIYYFIGLFFLSSVMVALTYIFFSKKIRLENIFLIGSLLFGTMYSIVLPPFAAPDESAHFVSAYNISSSILRTEQIVQEERVQQDPYNNDGYFNRYPNWDTYRRVYNSMMSSGQDFLTYYDEQYDYIKDYSIIGGHFVQAVSISVGRLLKLGYMPLVYLTRFINLLFYCIVIYIAIRIMPVCRAFMLGISFFPIVLEEAASVSYDGWIISFAFLYISYCLHCIYIKEKVRTRDTLLLILFLILCSNFKYIYYIMGGLLLLIPKEKLANKKQQYIIFGILAVMFCLMVGKTVVERSQPVTAEQMEFIHEKVAGFDRGQTYSMSDLLCSPKKLVEIYVNTVRDLSGEYLEQMIGQPLGSLNITVNRINIYFILILSFILALHGKGGDWIVNRRQGIVFAMVLVGVAGAAMLAMLVAWTNVSDNVIIGVQGRYFLPVLPLLGLLVSRLPIRIEKDMIKRVVCILFVINYFVVLDVFEYCIKFA